MKANSLSGKRTETFNLENHNAELETIHQETLDRETNERWEKWERERKGRADRDRGLFALLGSRTVMEASRNSGISRGTFYNFMKDPDFMAAYNDLKKEQRDRLEDDFFDLSEKAALVIKELLEVNTEKEHAYDKKLDPVYGLKVKTALRILDMASRFQGGNPPESSGAEITARASIPENTNAIAGAFVITEENP